MAAKHSPKNLSSFNCELTILQAKNIESPPKSDIFVRFYLSLSENSNCRLNTREIKSASNCFWNEKFSLECKGDEDSMTGLMEEASVVFELRQRTRRLSSVLGSSLLKKSKVLGRAEVPWRRVFEAPDMELEGWVDCDEQSGNKLLLPPSICVGVKVSYSRVPAGKMDRRRRRSDRVRRASEHELGCRDCQNLHHAHSCEDSYDSFAMAAALQAC